MDDGDAVAPRRGWIRVVLAAMLLALLGALGGLVLGVATPAHVEIAGSDTRIWLEPGKDVDQVGVTGVVTLRRPTDRRLLGETVAVRGVIDFDASEFVDNGRINTDLVPAYVAAYSDPDQLIGDIKHELIWHLLRFVIGGAAALLLLAGAVWGYRAWRRSYDRAHFPDGAARVISRSYRRPERTWLVRAAGAVVVVLVIGPVPSERAHRPAAGSVTANPILADTPLAGVEVDGLLSPALLAARNYVRTYFGQTDQYYDALRDKLDARLDAEQPEFPADEDVAQIGYVTDRHCNTGMDRVTIELLKRLGVRTLVSGGDDAFSGTFSFEAACTRNLAQQSAKADITDVMTAGNHDSEQTIAFEKDQKMTTLTGEVVTVDGLHFLGSPDPRASRYGEGIDPASDTAQQAVLDRQGASIGATACDAERPLVVVLHDPRAGTEALRSGCGNATLALDGHTHLQAGPVEVALPDGATGQQFTGGSSGGAPGEDAIDRTFASSLTVGPLNHDAFVNVLSIDRTTGRLVAMTEFRFTPAQDILITQTVVS